jgi:heavy metal sensor kinase
VYFKSLRFKLTLWYVIILGILLTSFSTFLYVTLSKSLYRNVDDKLRSLAHLIATESGSPSSRFGFGTIDQTLRASLNLRPIGKFIQVLDASGNVGQKSDNLENVQLPISLNALRNASKGFVTFETTRTFGNTPLRVVTVPAMAGDQMVKIVQVASSLEDVEDALNTLLLILIITVPSVLLIASVGGQFLANQALKPVDEVTQTARRITSENLDQRIRPLRVKDEISRLIETFNEMISRLYQSFRQIKQFTSDASHELKTPLTILRGEVEVALRKERTSTEYEQTLRSNLEEINRMSKIVDDLLLLSKTDIGEIRLNQEDVNLTQILNDVVTQLTLLTQAKNLRITTSNHEEDVHLFADGLRIRQLLLNLIENGIKYTEPGGAIHIALETDAYPLESSGSIRIAVSDTGIGIAKEDQERIFDRFFRVDKARARDQGGSGLGLSICKWIVEAHQGRISVESDPGKGSTFTIELPVSSSP